MKTTNYVNTFIAVSEDCPTALSEAPPVKAAKRTVANIQFDLIYDNPYKFTSDEVLFKVFESKNELRPGELEEEKTKFFSKGQPCFRSSPLTKRYGWGVHYNDEGKMAIYGVDSLEYQRFKKNTLLKQLRAMKSKKL